jgi:hypothetical protein
MKEEEFLRSLSDLKAAKESKLKELNNKLLEKMQGIYGEKKVSIEADIRAKAKEIKAAEGEAIEQLINSYEEDKGHINEDNSKNKEQKELDLINLRRGALAAIEDAQQDFLLQRELVVQDILRLGEENPGNSSNIFLSFGGVNFDIEELHFLGDLDASLYGGSDK